MGVQEVNLDIHPFKCSACKAPTAHRLVRTYECQDIPEAPPEVWLVECQRCFEMRIIYPSERVTSKEDDIARCDDCGNWKMKSARCRICRIAAGSETITRRVFTGHSDYEVPIADL